MSWFTNHWNKLSQQFDPNSDSSSIRRIQVEWGRETLQVSLPEIVTPPTVSDLKAALSSLTDIPPSNMKLITKGLTLKDDRLPLSQYGLSEGSKVMLIGSNGGPATPSSSSGYEPRKRKGGNGNKSGNGGQKLGGGDDNHNNVSGSEILTPGEEAARKRKLKEEDTSEEGLLNRIEEVRKDARKDLLPKVLQLERSIDVLDPNSNSTEQQETSTSTSTNPNPTSTSSASIPIPQATQNPSSTTTNPDSNSDSTEEVELAIISPSPQLSLLQRGTSEMLLRSLLSLDGIQVQSEATRQARKGAVREIQSWLDRVDAARERGVKLNWEGKSKV